MYIYGGTGEYNDLCLIHSLIEGLLPRGLWSVQTQDN